MQLSKPRPCSVSLCAFPGDRGTIDVDLACCAFSDSGSLMDAAYHSTPSAMAGAVRHCGNNPSGSLTASEDSEIVHVYPALLPQECCVLFFTLSTTQNKLEDCVALTLTVHSKDRKKDKVPACHLLI